MKNNNKERSFIIEYLKDFNGARAAIKAGYSRKAAKEIASRLLTKANIKESIEKALAKRQEKTVVLPPNSRHTERIEI